MIDAAELSTPVVVDHEATTHPRWDLVRRVAGQLLLAYAVLALVWIVIGRVLLSIDTLTARDQRLSEDLAAGRTPRADGLTRWGSLLSDTMVKIVVTLLLVGIAYAVWRRWRDVAMLALALVLEASVFITVTWVIQRPRPDVPRLEGSPVNSSYPSGHVAAAAAYGALVVVLAWHTRRWWVPVITGAVVAVVVAIVSYSRMYRGMHYLSDVIAGILLGVASIVAVWWILRHNGLTAEPLDAEPVEARRLHDDEIALDERGRLESAVPR